MFAVDDGAIHRAWDKGGELSGIVEFRRHFPLISDHAKARMCVRAIVSWTPKQAAEPDPGPAP